MACRGEKARLRDIGQLGLPLGDLQRLGDAPPLGDVGEGDDDAFDPVVLRAVGQDAANVPGAGPRLRFPVRAALSVCSTVRASSSSAPSAASEWRSASGRPMSLAMMLNSDLVAGVKKRIFSLGIEENRRDIGAVQDVLQVVRGRALPLQRFLKLAVEGGQLLVQRLQFFLRGQQLLVGRLDIPR